MLDLHVHLAHVVAAFVDGLNEELADGHFATDDALDRLDGGVDGAVAGGGCLERFAGDRERYAGYGAHPDAGRDLQVGQLDAMEGLAVFADKHEQVVVADFFFAVGQAEEVLIDFVELLAAAQVYAEHFEAMLERRVATAGGEYDAIVVDAHILGVDDFVRLHVLQHAVLMDAGGVREGVTAYDGFVGLHRHVHQAGDEAAGGVYALGVDVCVDAEARVVTLEDHGHFFERGVAGALADAIDGHFRLACAGQNAGHGVGRRHAEVVVTVYGEDCLVHAIDMLHEVADLLAKLAR